MRILDATSGPRGIWFNKNHPLVTYIDVREEVKPDRVMDCRNTDFADKTFDLIVFDPPHVGSTENNKGEMLQTYGHFRTEEIRNLIKGAFVEFSRILKDDGFVLFKWNDHDQKLEKILSLIQKFEPLFGQKTAIRTKHSSTTYWVCLKKQIYKND